MHNVPPISENWAPPSPGAGSGGHQLELSQSLRLPRQRTFHIPRGHSGAALPQRGNFAPNWKCLCLRKSVKWLKETYSASLRNPPRTSVAHINRDQANVQCKVQHSSDLYKSEGLHYRALNSVFNYLNFNTSSSSSVSSFSHPPPSRG